MQDIKLIKVNDQVIVFFNDGTSLQKSKVTDSEYQQIINADTEEEILSIMIPSYNDQINAVKEVKTLLEDIENTNILTKKGDSIYWEEISQLSLPKELVLAIRKAEINQDNLLLETYRNFWTLMSLNTDERCRQNLFWFLQKYGMTISRCGFFVAYRNVCTTDEKDELGNPIYTDKYTHSFKIKIGDMVTMNRKDCDDNQDVTCSKGLHCAGASWLQRNYFGDVGLVCLVNPAEVVAVPHKDNYGKLRTCAYLPVAKAEFDAGGSIKPYNVKDGFECEYVPKVIYEGLMGTEQDSTYKITIPNIPGINKESIADKLLDIARECITNRVV